VTRVQLLTALSVFQVVVNLFGNQNAVTTKCSSYPQVNSDSGGLLIMKA